jgi:hypothetical protein
VNKINRELSGLGTQCGLCWQGKDFCRLLWAVSCFWSSCCSSWSLQAGIDIISQLPLSIYDLLLQFSKWGLEESRQIAYLTWKRGSFLLLDPFPWTPEVLYPSWFFSAAMISSLGCASTHFITTLIFFDVSQDNI